MRAWRGAYCRVSHQAQVVGCRAHNHFLTCTRRLVVTIKRRCTRVVGCAVCAQRNVVVLRCMQTLCLFAPHWYPITDYGHPDVVRNTNIVTLWQGLFVSHVDKQFSCGCGSSSAGCRDATRNLLRNFKTPRRHCGGVVRSDSITSSAVNFLERREFA